MHKYKCINILKSIPVIKAKFSVLLQSSESHFVSGLTNRKFFKEHHLIEIEIFCNIVNVFTVSFYKFNENLLNKSIQFKK